MRKIACVVCGWMLAASLTACGPVSDFDGSRTGNDQQLVMEYSMFNTTDSQNLSAKTGDTIHAEIVVDSGSLSVKIQKDEEEPVYEAHDITASNEYDVEIEESGTYTVTVTGEKTKGSVSFTVENEIAKTYEQSEEDGILTTYYEMSDGTWKCDDTSYQFRLELTGTMPNAAKESYYAVLTNNDKLTFEDVSKS